MTRITENEIADEVIRYLAKRKSKEATTRQIKDALRDSTDLSNEDRRPSTTRQGEEVWEQQVRNIVSHRASPGNAICEGLLSRPSKGKMRITPKGELYAKSL